MKKLVFFLSSLLLGAGMGYLIGQITKENEHENVYILLKYSKLPEQAKLKLLEEYLAGQKTYEELVKGLGFTPEEAKRLIEQEIYAKTSENKGENLA